MCLFFFFFSSRRRHTRCSRDWSSDVCSSDLRLEERHALLLAVATPGEANGAAGLVDQQGVAGELRHVLGDQVERSEERRVGKECRARGAPYRERKKKKRSSRGRKRTDERRTE